MQGKSLAWLFPLRWERNDGGKGRLTRRRHWYHHFTKSHREMKQKIRTPLPCFPRVAGICLHLNFEKYGPCRPPRPHLHPCDNNTTKYRPQLDAMREMNQLQSALSRRRPNPRNRSGMGCPCREPQRPVQAPRECCSQRSIRAHRRSHTTDRNQLLRLQ
ncbi:hypothetical protein M413DRAFT_256681 [Hebeloma cylindrosporum]|uniref:Uncharacterized protein n=1 Tax=Hebeloma cylindrosporum TaxID=76867 RepID=A0A0C3BM85_HEBCY|nr:hypothetical protein M413DRAFT_256681 [Hebeloma cylindrosporum h7]